MMRTPTPDSIAYRWYRDMLAGDCPATHEGEPQCGWFKTRLVKGGPWVPARIWIEREIDPETGELCGPEEYRCEIDGEKHNAARSWISLCKEPISRADYFALIERAKSDPKMQATRVSIDLTLEPMKP